MFRRSGGESDSSMRTCRASLLTLLAAAALADGGTAAAGGLVSPAPATAATPTRSASPYAWMHLSSFAPLSLRELLSLRLLTEPVRLLPAGWEPTATSSYADDLHRTTIDLGLRYRFSGMSSAQLGARITVLDCISIDPAGRFALGDSSSRVHGLIGFTYRY
jgi:hypothetical protein